MQQYGVPQALYTDWHGAYHRPPTATERTRTRRPELLHPSTGTAWTGAFNKGEPK